MKYDHWLPKMIKVNGIVLFKTVYFALPKSKVSDRLMKHELEHVRQQEREGVFLFKIKYLLEYLKNLAVYRNHRKAYWNISYEIKARQAEKG